MLGHRDVWLPINSDRLAPFQTKSEDRFKRQSNGRIPTIESIATLSTTDSTVVYSMEQVIEKYVKDPKMVKTCDLEDLVSSSKLLDNHLKLDMFTELGWRYCVGCNLDEAPRNAEVGMHYLILAASEDYSDAHYAIYVCLIENEQVSNTISSSDAFEHLRKAVNNGHPEAAIALSKWFSGRRPTHRRDPREYTYYCDPEVNRVIPLLHQAINIHTQLVQAQKTGLTSVTVKIHDDGSNDCQPQKSYDRIVNVGLLRRFGIVYDLAVAKAAIERHERELQEASKSTMLTSLAITAFELQDWVQLKAIADQIDKNHSTNDCRLWFTDATVLYHWIKSYEPQLQPDKELFKKWFEILMNSGLRSRVNDYCYVGAIYEQPLWSPSKPALQYYDYPITLALSQSNFIAVECLVNEPTVDLTVSACWGTRHVTPLEIAITNKPDPDTIRLLLSQAPHRLDLSPYKTLLKNTLPYSTKQLSHLLHDAIRFADLYQFAAIKTLHSLCQSHILLPHVIISTLTLFL